MLLRCAMRRTDRVGGCHPRPLPAPPCMRPLRRVPGPRPTRPKGRSARHGRQLHWPAPAPWAQLHELEPQSCRPCARLRWGGSHPAAGGPGIAVPLQRIPP